MASADHMDVCMGDDDDDEFYSFSESETEDDPQVSGYMPLEPPEQPAASPTPDMGSNAPNKDVSRTEILTARAYQHEMFEESLKRNIILTVRWRTLTFLRSFLRS